MSQVEIYDANGAELRLGMEVQMPEPIAGDVHSEWFDGVIIGTKQSRGTVIVADRLGHGYEMEGVRIVSDDNNSDEDDDFDEDDEDQLDNYEKNILKQHELVENYDASLYINTTIHLKY